MAELARFYGIVISVFFRREMERHHRAHVHVRYGEWAASVAIDDATILAGKLPRGAKRLIRQWIRAHEAELLAAWRQAIRGQHPARIEPLR